MEYKPRFSQPFTLSEATRLDPFTLSEEIARLQNSLQHLQETQNQLRQHIQESDQPDPDFIEAIKENDTVIGSQKERITILQMALVEKGVIRSGGHYDTHSQPPADRTAAQPSPPPSHYTPSSLDEEEGGIIL